MTFVKVVPDSKDRAECVLDVVMMGEEETKAG